MTKCLIMEKIKKTTYNWYTHIHNDSNYNIILFIIFIPHCELCYKKQENIETNYFLFYILQKIVMSNLNKKSLCITKKGNFFFLNNQAWESVLAFKCACTNKKKMCLVPMNGGKLSGLELVKKRVFVFVIFMRLFGIVLPLN